MKLIGLKQNEEYYIINKPEDGVIVLPQWIDNIEKVLFTNVENLTTIEEKLSYYIDVSYPMSMTDHFITNREEDEYKYILRNNCIYTNAPNDKYLIIIYTSVPIDENGEPLIDLDIFLTEALVWFNMKELLWSASVRNPQLYFSLFQIAEREWKHYAINAKTSSFFPKNEDALRNLRNKYLKLLPNLKI